MLSVRSRVVLLTIALKRDRPYPIQPPGVIRLAAPTHLTDNGRNSLLKSCCLLYRLP
jgi:hypothetical protein